VFQQVLQQSFKRTGADGIPEKIGLIRNSVEAENGDPLFFL
jgi:hypothetical protein